MIRTTTQLLRILGTPSTGQTLMRFTEFTSWVLEQLGPLQPGEDSMVDLTDLLGDAGVEGVILLPDANVEIAREHLPRIPKPDLKQVGWTKAAELAKVVRRDGQRFDCATWLHRARELPKEEFKQEVERHLTGQETEPWVIIYFKLYKSRLPVVEGS